MKFRLPIMFFAIALVLLVGFEAASGQAKVNVRFRAGMSTTTLSGTTRGERYIDYVVRASEGQVLSVKLVRRSGEYPYFNVLKDGDAEAIAVDAREATEWSGKLPVSGAYVIRVYLAKAARLARRSSSYRITIGVTNRGGISDSPVGSTVYYVCDPNAELRADFMQGPQPSARIRYGTQDFTLPLVPSGSGSKYESRGTSFWVKGKQAMLDSKVLSGTCREK